MAAGLTEDTEVLLNPRLSAADSQKLRSLAGQYALAGHVWIASSGSTQSLRDSVKLIALSHKALLASAKAVNTHLESTAMDRWAQVLPRFHVGGLGVEVRAQLSGATVVSALKQKWDAQYFAEACENNQLTLASLVPTQVFDLVRLQLRSPSTLRAVVIGGGALTAELYRQARRLGWPLLPSFGMTEACSQVATAGLESLAKDDSAAGLTPPAFFKVLPHLEVRADSENLLSLRGSSLLTGYAQIRQGESIWIDPKDQAGWFASEDLVELKQGSLRPLGRRGDYVKINGEGVSLLPLQQRLEAVLLVRGFSTQNAVLVALSDPRQGAKLVLVFDSDVPEKAQEDIRADYNAQVLPLEKAHHLEELAEIPRSELGKVKRSQLLHQLKLQM